MRRDKNEVRADGPPAAIDASEVLALAMRLQARDLELPSEEGLVQMGRALGIGPAYIREAYRYHGGDSAPPTRPSGPRPLRQAVGDEPETETWRRVGSVLGLAAVAC
jgi:hypothetical protein